tara:strand:- start:52400 stop:52987 length:588 start_codon:yes stop_codon:yes gene_type:complete
MRYNINFILFFTLILSGCTNDLTDLESELNNPLDSDLLKCGLPAFSISPRSSNVTIGTIFSTDIFILEDPDSSTYIGGAKAVVKYDPIALEFVKAINGDISTGSDPLFFVDDSSKGKVEIISVFISGDSSGLNAGNNLLLATLQFRSLAEGSDTLKFDRTEDDSCNISFTTCELVDPDDQPILIRGFEDSVVNAD